MDPNNAEELTAARRCVIDRDLEHVKFEVFDTGAVLRGKYLSRDKFPGAADKDFDVCDLVLRRDSGDQLYDNAKFTDWELARQFEII